MMRRKKGNLLEWHDNYGVIRCKDCGDERVTSDFNPSMLYSLSSHRCNGCGSKNVVIYRGATLFTAEQIADMLEEEIVIRDLEGGELTNFPHRFLDELNRSTNTSIIGKKKLMLVLMKTLIP